MSYEFRELLKKVGSGTHTSEPLSRSQAMAATEMMLRQDATPAQIGAFMIAHRIRRPSFEELAGMLDAYEHLGPRLTPIATTEPVTVFCNPYDGRSRTTPISPLTALILATAGFPCLQHGGDRMPTKSGLPLIDVWRGLGVTWDQLSLEQVQQVLEATRLGFVYLPNHFPLAQGLVTYREQIGKRPPIATLELMWSPYAGAAHSVCGFVHPPTETLFRNAFALRGTENFTTVKGLEGSCDLPCDRTAILGRQRSAREFERLTLAPREFGFAAQEVALPIAPQDFWTMLTGVLQGQSSALLQAVLWNSGFYLWQLGASDDLIAGTVLAQELLATGKVKRQLEQVIAAIAQVNG